MGKRRDTLLANVFSHKPNAALQARGAAAATQERRLFPVACKRWLGWGTLWTAGGGFLSRAPTPWFTPFAQCSTPRYAPAHVYLITSSARKRSVGGMGRPSA